MGTITARRRSDGTTGYTAQIRLKRDGKVVHTESETFDRQALAREWLTRREAELAAQRARGEPQGKRMTLAELVQWYEGRERTDEPWGRTKRADVGRLKKLPSLSKRSVHTLTKQDFIAHVEDRRTEGVGPATASNDLVWLRNIFKTARAVIGIPVPLEALDEAADFLRGERIIDRPKERSRRLKGDEEARILEYFAGYPGAIPMCDVVNFALLTARREEEITMILREDLERATKTAKLRNVKDPRKKWGNHRRFRMLDEAWEIVERQPVLKTDDGKDDPRVFPYNAKSIGTAFTRAMKVLGIEDLRFHDLRHEAVSRLFERGYSIQEVAQFSLHRSWKTLQRYTHLRPEQVPERAAATASLP